MYAQSPQRSVGKAFGMRKQVQFGKEIKTISHPYYMQNLQIVIFQYFIL